MLRGVLAQRSSSCCCIKPRSSSCCYYVASPLRPQYNAAAVKSQHRACLTTSFFTAHHTDARFGSSRHRRAGGVARDVARCIFIWRAALVLHLRGGGVVLRISICYFLSDACTRSGARAACCIPPRARRTRFITNAAARATTPTNDIRLPPSVCMAYGSATAKRIDAAAIRPSSDNSGGNFRSPGGFAGQVPCKATTFRQTATPLIVFLLYSPEQLIDEAPVLCDQPHRTDESTCHSPHSTDTISSVEWVTSNRVAITLDIGRLILNKLIFSLHADVRNIPHQSSTSRDLQ